jgi:UDP:flavonoid glycosyltransferase YjiC (YdhE family)
MAAAGRYDIVIVLDPRFPGGTSAGVAAELEAQARAGYRTALVALKAPVLRFPHPFHPAIRAAVEAGWCEIVDPEARLDARLLLVHHPQVMTHPPLRPLRIRTEQRLLVVQHPPFDGAGAPSYDWRQIADHAAEVFGEPVLWAPLGPAVRAQLQALGAEAPPLLDEDWPHVLDPARWAVARPDFVGPGCVIGRHARPDPLKWPATREEILEIYPADSDFTVRILGGGPFLAALVGGIPASWQVLPFDHAAPQAFLAGIDFFVYYHHPRWVEAFGRTVIEALGAGCVAVLPPTFRAVFGDAALYAEASSAARLVRELRRTPERVAEQRRRGLTAVQERFSLDAHGRRLAALIGPPGARGGGPRSAARPRRILLISSNGVGLGHLTRTLAIARRLPPPLQPVIVTMSQALAIVAEQGFLVEHLPFHGYLEADAQVWNQHLAAELGEIFAFYDPRVILFDGHVPYAGLVEAFGRAPAAWTVWVRRGMWQADAGTTPLEREAAFDCVIEPRDLAERMDRGPTRGHRTRTRRVPPIRLLDPAETLSRGAARAELGLPSEGRCVLLQLGSGNNFDYGAVRERLLERLRVLPDVTVAAVRSPIAYATPEPPADVRSLVVFPLARHLPAFDAAISAAGYNSYHELLQAGVPTLFVPNENPTMDDQLARARHAERQGLALCLRAHELYRARDRLEQLLDPEEQALLRARMAALDPANGAPDAARIVAEMAWCLRADRPEAAP